MGHSEGARFLWIRIVIPLTLDTYPHVLPGLGDAAAGAMDEALGWFGCSTLGPRYPWRRIPYSSLSGGISSRSSVRAFKACRSLTPRPSNPHLDKRHRPNTHAGCCIDWARLIGRSSVSLGVGTWDYRRACVVSGTNVILMTIIIMIV